MRGTRRRFTRGLVAASVAVLAPRRAFAASDVRVEVKLDRERAQIGEPLQIQIAVIREGGGDVQSPGLPEGLEEDFEVRRCVPQLKRSTINFRSSVARLQTCVIVPRRTGAFEFVASVDEGGKKVRSNRVELTVIGEDEAAAETTVEGPTQPRGDVFLWAGVDKPRAYVGEQVTYRLDIFERRRFLDPHLRTPPGLQDFFSIDLPTDEPTRTQVGGVDYVRHPAMRRALFPQRAGNLVIGAAEIGIGLRRRERSEPVEVEVIPLPAEGQPKGFSASNVGRYAIEASVDRTEVAPGEPLTLTVTVEGVGNIDVVAPEPWPDIPGIRRYDPKVDIEHASGLVVGGKRTWTFLLIVERTGTVTIVPHALHYFDPTEQSYETLRTVPIEISVGGGGVAIEAIDEADAGRTPTVEQTEPLQPIFAAEVLPRDVPRDRWLTPARWLYGMVAVPVLAGLGLGGGALLRRFGPDDAARSRARTRLRRRVRIEAAQQAVDSGKGFHAALAALLQELAVQRAGSDGVGLPRPELVRLLEQRGVEREDRRRLEELLDRCDAARFAALQGTAAERQALLEDALGLVRSSSLSKGVG
jgi:hypothetical protein